jgi:hypothetical protein
MELFGDLERFLSEDLYPYRWPITVGVAVAVFAGFLLAFRLGWHRAVRRHPAASAVLLLATIAIVIPAAWYVLSPLWERSYLEEASPLEAASVPTAAASPDIIEPPAAAAPASPAPVQPTVAAGPRLTHAGMFTGADDFHFGRGDAQLIETAPGVYTLRFENFSVRNGPDLFVYLTADPSGESIDGAINLGELKATDGAFNYDVPPGTDVSQFASAIVWCRQFATLFAVAELMEV